MVKVDIQIKGVDKLKTMSLLTSDIVEEVARSVALSLEREIKQRTPVDTGRLRGAYQYKKTGKGQYQITNNVEYLFAVNDGTGEYGPTGKPIEAATGKVLAFMVKGTPVFAKSVKGQKGKHFVEESIESVENNIEDIGDAAVKRVLKGAS